MLHFRGVELYVSLGEMSEQTKSVVWLSVILAAVILLIVSAVKYFGPAGPHVAKGEAEVVEVDDGSPYVIRSIPSRAEVYINNSLVGSTPYKYESFDPGILRIRLEHAELAPVETLLIVPEDGPIPVFPEFVFSIPVELTSLPSGAQPVVNGRALRPYEIASYSVPATDTLEVSFELEGEASEPVRFNPLVGLVEETDTTHWQWRSASAEAPAQLTGVFAARIRVTSIPAGADIYLDNNPVPIGRTDDRVAIPYGDHKLTLRLAPFDDAIIEVSSAKDRRETIFAVLSRAVWLAAVDAQNPFSDLNARVSWVRQGQEYVINPDDGISTPRNILLEGRGSEMFLTCPGYADTTVFLPAFASEITVAMRPLPKIRQEEPGGEDEEMAWVRFVVKQGRKKRVAGAEVFGVDKHDGRTVRYGPTDENGILTARVPIGDYNWWAERTGFESAKPNGERVKKGRKTKEITLKMKPM